MHSPAPNEGWAPRRLWRLPSWLINQTTLHANRLVGESFAAAGVRRHHFTVLVTLDDGGPASQAELGRRLSMDRSDMVAVLNDLEGAGLVTRARDETDRRRNVVRITPAGVAELKRLDARAEAAQDALLEPLSTKERRELERLLTRVVEFHGERHRGR